jgi:hypothetical protein
VPVISNITANNVSLLDLTVTHSGHAVVGGDGIIVRNAAGVNYATIERVDARMNWRGFVLGCAAFARANDLKAENNNSHGFEFVYDTTCSAAQWNVVGSLAQLNKGVGFAGSNTQAANGIGPFFYNSWTFGNDFGGFIFSGTATTPLNDLLFYNIASSADNNYGLWLNTYGVGHIITNPWIELSGRADGFPLGSALTPSVMRNQGDCLALTVNNLGGIIINGGFYWNCSWSGVNIEASYSGIVGGTTLGNGRALDVGLFRRAGVRVGAAGDLVMGHSFKHDGTAATQEAINFGVSIASVTIGHNTYQPPLSSIPPSGGTGTGDVTSTATTSVENELALFTGTTGKIIKRATGTGLVKITAGVQGLAIPGTDYQEPIAGIPDPSIILTTTNTKEVSNKQIVPRVNALVNTGGSVAYDCDTTDVGTLDGITAAITLALPTCTGTNPKPEHEIEYRLQSTLPQPIAYNAAFCAMSGFALPTATSGDIASVKTYDRLKFKRNAVESCWTLVATTTGVGRGVTTLSPSTTYTCDWRVAHTCQMSFTAASTTIVVAAPPAVPADGTLTRYKFLCTSAQTLDWSTAGVYVASPNVPFPASCPADVTKYFIVGIERSSVLGKYQVIATN